VVILHYLGLKQIEAPINLPDIIEPVTRDLPTATTPSSPQPTSKIPISEAQREAAEKAGIDIDSIVITPEMEACAREKLGDARVEEIIKGDVPGPLDIIKASSCLSN
jgi:hypothetical protein